MCSICHLVKVKCQPCHCSFSKYQYSMVLITSGATTKVNTTIILWSKKQLAVLSASLTPLPSIWRIFTPHYRAPAFSPDRFGGAEAGTFCALSTLYDQLRHGGSVDVYMTSKLYHLQRPGIFPKEVGPLGSCFLWPSHLSREGSINQ